jgi:hypothetical protein
MKNKKVFKGGLVAQPGIVYDYEEITGNVAYADGATVCQFPALTTCGGSAYANGAKECQFPALTTCGGSARAEGATECQFPALTTCGGSADANGAKDCQFPALTTCGGSADANGEKDCQFPALTTCGGSAYANGAKDCQFPKLKKHDDQTAIGRCRSLVLASFAAYGFSFADGVLARIVSQRGHVSRVIVCGKKDISFIVTDGDSHSHGATLKEARDGLLYKISSRDTSEFKRWTLEKVVSKRDAIRAYRAITGACELGVRDWMEQHEVPEKISVGEIIKLTNGSYGSEEFEKFFTK